MQIYLGVGNEFSEDRLRFTAEIIAVDFRNIVGDVNNFREAWPDEGQADTAATMKAYKDAGFDGPMCPDYIIGVDRDSKWGHRY